MTALAPSLESTSAAEVRSARRLARRGLWAIFLLVFAAELAFGMWMNHQGYRAGDAASRASIALSTLYGSDPHLAAVGFVWMPLPTLLELLPASTYPVFASVVSSGFAFTSISALAAGATAALLLLTCVRLGLPTWLGWVYALLIAANPMLFLYGSNGMSEGVAAPCLIGAVCFLTLFWYSGQRLYVGAAGVSLALGFASIYEAVPFGAALLAALVGAVLWVGTAEAKPSVPVGRPLAILGLGLVLILPSAFVGLAWLVANAAVMGDPLHFARGPYGSFEQNRTLYDLQGGGSYAVAGDVADSLLYVAERTWPFLVPVAALLLVRALERRLFRANTLLLVLLAVTVPLALFAPLLYRGLSIGHLRYFMYPLFVAAGWGLYEIALSKHRRRAAAVILAGWIAAAGTTFWAMGNPSLGGETEHYVVEGIVHGESAESVDFPDPIGIAEPIAEALAAGPFAAGERVVADQLRGFAIAAHLEADHLSHLLLLTPDRRFEEALDNPAKLGVTYLLVPNPQVYPADAIVRAHPLLWQGLAPGFDLVTDFPGTRTQEQWRLYAVAGGP